MQTFYSIRMIRAVVAFFICLVPSGASAVSADLLEKEPGWYASEEGRKTTVCILSWQSEHGSWPKAEDTAHQQYSGDRGKIEGTFDNKATIDELRYLARAFRATKDPACGKAFLLGLNHILAAQYANGGWPQSFPHGKKAYPRHITFNDGSMVRLLEFLREVADDDAYAFVDPAHRTAAGEAVQRGIGCILQCQIIINGKPAVWCAQHDEASFAPATARAYELPSLSGSESAGILRFLMSIKNPSPEVIKAVKGGVAWFEASKIEGIRIEKVNGDRQVIKDPKADPIWARFYDLETQQPFFCDRDGVKKHELSGSGKERRNGYAWYGNWGEAVAKDHAKWPHR